VYTGDAVATITTHAIVLGKDQLTIRIADEAPVGSAPITVTRGDGVQARDPKGVGVLAFEVLAKPGEPADHDASDSPRTGRRRKANTAMVPATPKRPPRRSDVSG